MKLHLPKLLLTAVMAAITFGSGLAKADIYTLTGLKETDTEMAYASYTLTNYDAETQEYTLTDTVLSDAWGGGTGDTAQMVQNRHTLRFAADQEVSNHALTYTFANWAIGGLIVESGATAYSITAGDGNRPFKIYDGSYNIGEDFTINTSSGTDGDNERITLFGTQTWNIAAGKTMSFNSGTTPVRIDSEAYVSITGSGTMSFAPGLEVLGTLDLTAISLPDDSTNTDDVKVMNLMNSASGSGTIKLKAGSVIQTMGTKTAVTLNTNYVVEGDASAKLVLTSHTNNSAWRTWTIGESGSITVGSGLGTLEFLAGQKAIINGGSITVGTLALGHTTASDADNSYSGALEMKGSGSTLTVGKIKVQNANTAYANRKNEVVITGGTLKVTGESAIEYATDAQTTVLIGGTGTDSVILQTGSNNWILSKGAATGSSLEIGNITIDAANEKMITITNAYLNGLITNNATNDAAGLTLSGNFTTGSGFWTQSYTGTKDTGFSTKLVLTGLGTSEKTILSSGITFDGVGIGDSGWTLGDDGYYYRAMETSNLFHVYGTTNIDDNIYQAGTNFIGFEVHSGGTLNIAGHEVQGLKVYLNENATLANNGTAIGETTRQYDQVILKGNAYADTAANFGLLAGSYNPTTLDLAGYTLTKTGTADFLLVNTTVKAGTIDVQQGGLKLISKDEGKSITLEDGVNINVASGAYVNLATDDLTSDQILAITGAGEVRINSTITLGEGTAALSGTFVTASGSLTINGTTIGALRTNDGSSSTVANGSVTNLTSAGGTTNVTGGSVTTLSATGGTTNVSGGSVTTLSATGGTTNISGGSVTTLSTTGGTINVTGGSITTVKMKGSGNQNLNFKLADGATSASYTLDSLSTIDTESYGCNITIDSGVTVEANSVTPGWGFGTITVNGSLKLTEMLELATGRNNDTTRNVITGSGIIDTKKLSIGNIGTYNISGVTMKIGEGGIKKGSNYDARYTKTNLGAMTIEAKADWDSDVDTLKLVATGSDSTVINTAGHTVALKAGLGGTGNLTKTGEGTLKIGENSTTFTSGAVTVSGGKLELNKADGNYTISSLTLNGGALDVTGSVTLNALTVDFSKYSTDTLTHTLVTSGGLSLGEGVDLSQLTFSEGDYTGSVARVGESLVLSYVLAGDTKPITTTVSTFELNGTALTLNVEEAVLSEGMVVNVRLLDDTMMKDILAALDEENYINGKPMVTITLAGSESGTITANELNEVVFVKGDTGQNYWGEMVGSQLMYNVERIPEPASATLSLAALMMLCARRRRQK